MTGIITLCIHPLAYPKINFSVYCLCFSKGCSNNMADERQRNNTYNNRATFWSDYSSYKRPNEEPSESQPSRKRTKYTNVPCSASGNNTSYMGKFAGHNPVFMYLGVNPVEHKEIDF